MRPHSTQYHPYYEPYISKVKGEDIYQILCSSLETLKDYLAQISESKADFAYAPEKWTVKQVLQHCIDNERIFAYRALCFARGETQPLPGYDQNIYMAHTNVDDKSLQSLKDEMVLIRQSSIMMYQHFTPNALNNTGTVGGNLMSVSALGFVIVGHWLHHQDILTTKYGISSSA